MATATGLLASASLQSVDVTTGSEARPATGARILWIGGSTQPSNMQDGDIWFRAVPTGPSQPSFITTSLNTLTQDVAFSQSLLLNGTPPFTFTVVSGELPTGLTINSTTGIISGTPTVAAAYSFSVQAENAIGSDTQAYSGTVSATAVAPTITTTTLNSLTQSTAFSQTLAATGTSPLTWTISAGTIPSGLNLNSSTGAITGSPTGSGAYSFTVQATNTAGNDTQAYSGTIASSGTAPTITTTVLNALQVGFSFSQTLSRTGSTPMTWGISAGTIPSGLSINSTTGVISGTPTTDGAYSFTVQAVNSFGSDTQVFTGSIDPVSEADVYSIFGATTLALTSHTDADVGAWVSQQFYQAGTPLPAGSKLVGARLFVPTGSAHIGQFWYAANQRFSGGFYPDLGTFPVADYDTNGTKKTGAVLVEGWNEIIFNAEVDVTPVGGGWFIGVQIGDGTRYLHSSTLTTDTIQNPEGENFYLAEQGDSVIRRTWYNASPSSARSYGIDTLVSIPE